MARTREHTAVSSSSSFAPPPLRSRPRPVVEKSFPPGSPFSDLFSLQPPRFAPASAVRSPRTQPDTLLWKSRLSPSPSVFPLDVHLPPADDGPGFGGNSCPRSRCICGERLIKSPLLEPTVCNLSPPSAPLGPPPSRTSIDDRTEPPSSLRQSLGPSPFKTNDNGKTNPLQSFAPPSAPSAPSTPSAPSAPSAPYLPGPTSTTEPTPCTLLNNSAPRHPRPALTTEPTPCNPSSPLAPLGFPFPFSAVG